MRWGEELWKSRKRVRDIPLTRFTTRGVGWLCSYIARPMLLLQAGRNYSRIISGRHWPCRVRNSNIMLAITKHFTSSRQTWPFYLTPPSPPSAPSSSSYQASRAPYIVKLTPLPTPFLPPPKWPLLFCTRNQVFQEKVNLNYN